MITKLKWIPTTFFVGKKNENGGRPLKKPFDFSRKWGQMFTHSLDQ